MTSKSSSSSNHSGMTATDLPTRVQQMILHLDRHPVDYVSLPEVRTLLRDMADALTPLTQARETPEDLIERLHGHCSRYFHGASQYQDECYGCWRHEPDKSKRCAICQAAATLVARDATIQRLTQEIDVLRPPAENYNRTLARAERAEAAIQQVTQERCKCGVLSNVSHYCSALDHEDGA